MERRQALCTMGLLAMAGHAAEAMAKGATMTDPQRNGSKIRLGSGPFLSSTNPIATVEQRDLEALALQLIATPQIRAARDQARRRFLTLAGPDVPAEALQDFDSMMDEWTFHKLLLALNGDPNYPTVLGSTYGPPHQWFGRQVPGCRGPGTAENVDNNYVIIPVDGHSRFEIHGQRFDPPTGDCPIHLESNLSMSMNIDSLLFHDTVIAADGSFIITVDPHAAGGRRNHLQSTPDTRYVYIRDARVNWNQIPSAFTVRRLDPPTAPPLTVEQKAAMGARFILDDVSTCFGYRQIIASTPINTLMPPAGSGFVGGQASQMLGTAHLKLTDDEAFVIHVSPGGAGYHLVVANNWWMMSLDFWNHTSTLNNTQAVANADGSYTYVVSVRDPGVHNWIDTVGLHETLIVIRWQLLPRAADGSFAATASTQGSVIRLQDLDQALPAGTQRVTTAERARQRATRIAEFGKRYTV